MPDRVRLQIGGAEDAAVGATLVVALLVDHPYPGCPTALQARNRLTPNIGASRATTQGRPYGSVLPASLLFPTPIVIMDVTWQDGS